MRVARIFNTYGPRMHMKDGKTKNHPTVTISNFNTCKLTGRVVSNFIMQALKSEPITVYGSGKQTRSFQFVDDLIEGLVALMNSNYTLPVNFGNQQGKRNLQSNQ